MLFTFASLCLPPLLVFGVYHLLTWFDAFGINERAFWKRVALASATCHVLLASGFFVFSYLDFEARLRLAPADAKFGAYPFDRSDFRRLMTSLHTPPILVIITVFSGLHRARLRRPGLLVWTL